VSAFDDLKKKGEATYAADKVATESWVKAHRTTIFIAVISAVIGFILAKAF